MYIDKGLSSKKVFYTSNNICREIINCDVPTTLYFQLIWITYLNNFLEFGNALSDISKVMYEFTSEIYHQPPLILQLMPVLKFQQIIELDAVNLPPFITCDQKPLRFDCQR